MASNDLTALVFELQRARSPKDKAKVLARAWRTVRGLDPSERRLLAREVGFDGAEELIEGLGGKERGVFAPAAVLEALGKMRSDPEFSVRRVINDLRDPDRRDDLLMRGMDLVAETVTPEPEPEIDIQRLELPDGNVWMMEEEASAQHDRALELDDGQEPDTREQDVVQPRSKARPPRPPVPGSEAKTEPKPRPEAQPEPLPEPAPEPNEEPELESKPEPEPEPETRQQPQPTPKQQLTQEPEQPSPWDTLSARSEPGVSAIAGVTPGLMEMVPRDRSGRSGGTVAGSAIQRLRELRRDMPRLGSASVSTLSDRLESFPEPWARRRALVALIESGVPEDPSGALDLIAGMERPVDRRWCLSTLARRGDLVGEDLERALAMLTSPAARRRVAGLAG